MSALVVAMLEGKFLIFILSAGSAADFPHARSESFYQHRCISCMDKQTFCSWFTQDEITPRTPMEERNDCKIQYIWRSNYRSTFNHIELYKDKSLEKLLHHLDDAML